RLGPLPVNTKSPPELPLRSGPHHRRPSAEEREAADRCDGTETANARQRERIEAAGEECDAGDEEPGGGAERGAVRFLQQQKSGRQQSDPVPEVVLNSRLPDRELVRCKTRLQCMRAERAGGDTGEHQRGGERQSNSGRHLRYNAWRPASGLIQDSTMIIERRHVGKRLSELVINRASSTAYLAGQVA